MCINERTIQAVKRVRVNTIVGPICLLMGHVLRTVYVVVDKFCGSKWTVSSPLLLIALGLCAITKTGHCTIKSVYNTICRGKCKANRVPHLKNRRGSVTKSTTYIFLLCFRGGMLYPSHSRPFSPDA